jgi:hypothetical protein
MALFPTKCQSVTSSSSSSSSQQQWRADHSRNLWVKVAEHSSTRNSAVRASCLGRGAASVVACSKVPESSGCFCIRCDTRHKWPQKGLSAEEPWLVATARVVRHNCCWCRGGNDAKPTSTRLDDSKRDNTAAVADDDNSVVYPVYSKGVIGRQNDSCARKSPPPLLSQSTVLVTIGTARPHTWVRPLFRSCCRRIGSIVIVLVLVTC